MPRFREYEYTRNALQATCRVAARQQVKIVEFYSGEGAPKLPQVLKHALRLGSLSFEEFDQRWVRVLRRDSFRGSTKSEPH